MEYEIGRDEQVSTAVVRAASAVAGCEPRTLRPLADVLDPEALDALFDSQDGGRPRRGGRLSFVYSDCRISVDNGEYLSIEPLDCRRRDGDGREPYRNSPPGSED